LYRCLPFGLKKNNQCTMEEEPTMLRSTGDRGALLAKTLQNHVDVVLIDPYVMMSKRHY
jgi:transposase